MNELCAYAHTLEQELNDCADLAEVDRVLASIHRVGIEPFLAMVRERQEKRLKGKQ